MNTQTQPTITVEGLLPARVLVIDDDASILGVVAEVLDDEGYKVTTAGSGEEAVEILKNETFTLVMSDIRLPKMNGIAVLEHVKKVSPATQVIMITSHGSLDTSMDAMKMGAYDYLLKPFDDINMISNAAARAIEAYNLDADRSQLIRSLKQSNDKLSQLNQVFHGMAVRDGLTDLFNHRHINEILDQEIEKSASDGTELSVVFIDVDHFKAYNDTNGHQNGDLLLRELSLVMRKNVRHEDQLARWGGEEFVIVCPNMDDQAAAAQADYLRTAIALKPFNTMDTAVTRHITISAGVASLKHYPVKAKMIEAADKALYRAKRKGRDQICIALPD